MTRCGGKPAQNRLVHAESGDAYMCGNQLVKEVTESNLSILYLISCVTEGIEIIRHKLVVVGFNQSCELKTRSH